MTAIRIVEANKMKSAKLIRIMDALIDNEIVRFEADDGTTLEVSRSSSTFEDRTATSYTLATKSRTGRLLAGVFFNRYEDDGGDVRLYWNASIVGMMFPKALEVESESIYS